ncbi:hypothetical protein HID58_012031, partial [Brassica napus]
MGLNTANPLEFTSFTPTTLFDASIYPLREKKLVKKPKEQRRRKTKKNEIRRSLIFSVLKVVVLALYLELGFSLMRKGVLESEFTEDIVRISDDRSHSGRDVGEKVTILEDELMGFAKSINFLRCRGSNSNWRINQDGLMLKSRSVYKSVTEEVNVWGWPLQTGGLFGTGFSSSSFNVLSGRVTNWSEGRFGYSVREANISWGKTKWSTSVLQLDHSTWVLENNLMNPLSIDTDGAVERVNAGGVKTCTKIIAGCAHDEKSEDRFGGDSDVFDVCGDQSSNFEHKFLDDAFRKISNSIQGVNSHVKELAQRFERVKSLDLHPTEP